MNGRKLSLGLCVFFAVAGSAALVNCAALADDKGAELSEDQLTGIHNALGLGVRYVEETGAVEATLPKPLGEDERLFVRVRRGKLTLTSQKDLDCNELMNASTKEANPTSPASVHVLTTG